MEKIMPDNDLVALEYFSSSNIVKDSCAIIDAAQKTAYKTVDRILVVRNWLIGKRISEDILEGQDRAEYGAKTIRLLSDALQKIYGSGFDRVSLYRYLKFHELFPDIVATPELQSSEESNGIVATLRQQLHLLSWSHYRVLLQVFDEKARNWYEKEAYEQGWSVRTLQRNVYSQYYYRLLKSPDKADVEQEIKNLTTEYQEKLEFIKNPVIAEFLGMQQDTSFQESELEQAIISNLQKFLMELGKGYAFVARQQRIQTEKEEYFIDLVFYNYILKCFVLIDLKTGKIKHQDVGQMDMYIRMYDELKRGPDDNPTLGIVLCTETDDDIARYSVMHGNEQLFASKYKLYLPSEEELKAEIENQKMLFKLQHSKDNSN